jgi:succinyl-CoA:acetate CoA-transferase
LSAYTEVIQDAMLDLIENGTLSIASATALSLSHQAVERFADKIACFRRTSSCVHRKLASAPS